MTVLDTLSIIATVTIRALTPTRITHSSRLKAQKSMSMAMGITRVLIKSKQVGVALTVAAIRHQGMITTRMGMDMIAAFNQTRQTLVAR
jgi:hypothetical protein